MSGPRWSLRAAPLLLVPLAVLVPGVAVGATLGLADRSTPISTGSWAAVPPSVE